MNMGYAVYDNQNDISTDIRGHVADFKLKVLDSATFGLNQMTSLAMATLAAAFLFWLTKLNKFAPYLKKSLF